MQSSDKRTWANLAAHLFGFLVLLNVNAYCNLARAGTVHRYCEVGHGLHFSGAGGVVRGSARGKDRAWPGFSSTTLIRMQGTPVKKTFLTLSAPALFPLASTAMAASDTASTTLDKPLTLQQLRMKDCNRESTGKSGIERKTFMSDCLKNGTHSAVAPPRDDLSTEKMKDCNAQAAMQPLKGYVRKTFMNTCLKS